MTARRTIAFQTGRLYTEAGQRIAACQLPNGAALFMDIDRCIDGVTTDEDDRLTRDRIMVCYDYGHYRFATADNTGLSFDDLRDAFNALRDLARAVQKVAA